MAQLVVKVLGPVVAERAGTSLPLGGAKPRLTLALLASSAGKTVSVDQLIDGLWGEEPPPTARKSLQVHISALRKSLDESAIITTDGGYELEAALDSFQLESFVADASRLLPLDPHAALAPTERAIALWRGDPYADLADEEALRGERARLEELRLQAFVLRFRALLDLGRHEEALGDLDALTRANPYREELRSLQMLVLYRSGRQVDALRAFQETRRILGEDLGVDPSAELRDLEQRILDHDPTLQGPSSKPEVPSTLPVRPVELVGRTTDVEVVRELLGTSRLVTITGVGGAGKTSLAIETAHGVVSSHRGGVFFVDLTSIGDDDDVLGTTMDGMGLPVVGIEPTLDRIVDFLRPRSCLLVMDNCEHVLDGTARLISYLLNRCSELTVMATSREALSVPGEQVYRIPLLGSEDVNAPAVELFLRRAREADFDFALEDGDRDLVVEICNSLDGIPLAIELAASQTRSMALAEIKERLDDRFSLLAGSSRNPILHHQTLLATVEWSYSLLTDMEQTMLRRLSVFHGGFDISDVAAVTGVEDPEAALLVDALVAKSLVHAGRGTSGIRLGLLETIRLFAQEKLREDDDASGAGLRHHARFIGSMQGTSFNFNNHHVQTYHRNERELSNLITAMEWGLDHGHEAESALTVARVFWPMVNRGIVHKYQRLLENDYDLSPDDLALLLTGRMMVAFDTIDSSAARSIAEIACALDPEGLLDDGFTPRIGEFGFAPVEGAEERLAFLEEVLPQAERSATPSANIGMVEMHRAGQFYSLARLDDALAAAHRASQMARAGGHVFWDEVLAELALLVLLGRRGEAQSLLSELEGLLEGGAIEIGRGVSAVGSGDPLAAGKALAESAYRNVTGRQYLQEGDYLCLFAAYRFELGDRERAYDLLKSIQPRYGVIQWLVWPYVWEWTPETFVAGNAEARGRELARMSQPRWDSMVMARLLAEELDFWQS